MTAPDTDDRTISDAKEEVEQLEGRIETLENIGTDPNYIDDLREERDDLVARIEASEDHARKRTAAEKLLVEMAESDHDYLGEI